MSQINEAIKQLMLGQDLEDSLIRDAFTEIMTGVSTQAQTASFLTALAIKGETPEEITACADVMRSVATPLETGRETLEIVGTGGDRLGTFNISTASAIVCAAAGIPTTKHGNRSVSSRSGAADCLEALGVPITLESQENEELLDETNFCFMFAPVYHSAMKYAAPVRKELGVPTIFNILGPLTNPAKASIQLLGVFDESLIKPMARVLRGLGVTDALVVHGSDGADEITITGETRAAHLHDGVIEEFTIRPEDFGYERSALSDIQGENAEENAKMIEKIFDGERSPRRDVVCMNAGAAMYLAGLADSLESGVKLAELHIDSGQAKDKLEEIREKSREILSEEIA